MQALVGEAFREIGEERWRSACDHTEKVLEKMKANDLYTDDRPQEIIINLEDDTTDTASETECC
jgi:hypothetical protein